MLPTLLFMTGCGAVDLTKNHQGAPPVCAIHQVAMHSEHIIVWGSSLYIDVGYVDYAHKHFPNHGRHLYNGEREGTPRDREIIDFVCPKCDEAYKKYWNDK